MSLGDELVQAIGEAIKRTDIGLRALTEGPQAVPPQAEEALADVLRLREAVHAIGETIEARLRALG